MKSDSGSLNQVKSGKLWLPFLLIIIGLIMELIELIYVIISYNNQYYFSDRSILFLIHVLVSLGVPFIVTGIALLLIFLIKPIKGITNWSITILICGTVLLIFNGILSIVIYYDLVINQDYFSDFLTDLGLAGSITGILGIALCAIASLLFARAFFKGEMQTKHPGGR